MGEGEKGEGGGGGGGRDGGREMGGGQQWIKRLATSTISFSSAMC